MKHRWKIETQRRGKGTRYCWWKKSWHHLGCIKPGKWWDKLPINWCRISSINSMYLNPPVGFEIWATKKGTKNRPFVARVWQPNEGSRERLFMTFSANDPEPHEGTVPFIYICLTLIVTIILCVSVLFPLDLFLPTHPTTRNTSKIRFSKRRTRMVLDSGSSTLAFCNKQFIQDAQYQSSQYVPWCFFGGRCNQVVWWSSYYKLHRRKLTWNLDFTPQKKRRNIDPTYHFLGWKAVCFSGPVHV